jgi:hypothetical protein
LREWESESECEWQRESERTEWVRDEEMRVSDGARVRDEERVRVTLGEWKNEMGESQSCEWMNENMK